MKTKYYISLFAIFIALRFMLNLLFEGFGLYKTNNLDSDLAMTFFGAVSSWLIALGSTILIRHKIYEITVDEDIDDEEEGEDTTVEEDSISDKSYNIGGILFIIFGALCLVFAFTTT